MADCDTYREALEQVVDAFGVASTGVWLEGWIAATPTKVAALKNAEQVLVDNLVSHRHEGWEGPAEACPICRRDSRIAELETAVGEAIDVLVFLEVFVKSGERIKKPEGHELFNQALADLRRVKEKRDG